MQHLEDSGALRHIYVSLGFKRLIPEPLGPPRPVAGDLYFTYLRLNFSTTSDLKFCKP